MDDRFGVFYVYVAEVVIPILVNDLGGLGKFTSCDSCIYLRGSGGKFVQDPEFGERLVACFRGSFLWREVLIEFSKNVLSRLIDLIAEPPVPVHLLDIKVNVTT